MINKKEYTLFYLQNVKSLFAKITDLVNANTDIVDFVKRDPFELVVEDKSKLSDFQFSVKDPKQDKNKVHFNISYNPYRSDSLSTRTMQTETKGVLQSFEYWISLIRSYNVLDFTEDDSILNEYEKEFFENFEILDEDADTSPYELEKQIIIDNYFSSVIRLLQKNKVENKELIEEAIEIKNSIPKMTKKATVKRMSGFFAKARKKSLTLLKELLEVGKKEVFKKAVNFALENFGDLITSIG